MIRRLFRRCATAPGTVLAPEDQAVVAAHYPISSRTPIPSPCSPTPTPRPPSLAHSTAPG